MTATQRVDVERLSELLAVIASSNPDRRADYPGGCDCHECGCIFIGGDGHDYCAQCEAKRQLLAMLPEAIPALLQQLAEAERARDIYKAADESMQEAHSQALNKLAERDAEIERERSRREHTQQWYAERLVKIEEIAKREGLWNEVAAVIANGSGTRQLPNGSYFYDPPTYAQQLNTAKHRAEAAERAREGLASMFRNATAELDRLATEKLQALSVISDIERVVSSSGFLGGPSLAVCVDVMDKTARGLLREVCEWIEGWSPNFVDDPEWQPVADRIAAFLAANGGRDEA